MDSIRLMIVDDHQLFIDGLILILEKEASLQVVATANNGVDALQQLRSIACDVVMLDVEMPQMDGLESCKQIRKLYPETKIIALTTYDRSGVIRQMLQSGASGYLLKNTNKNEFIKAIATVAEGGTYLSSSASQSLINSIMNRTESGSLPQLTRREKEVLQLISQENSSQEIADQLHLSPNTIEYHRKNLFSKLNVKNVAGLIRVAMERGLLE